MRPRAHGVVLADATLAWCPSERGMGTRRPILLHEACFALFAGAAFVRFAVALGPASSDALL